MRVAPNVKTRSIVFDVFGSYVRYKGGVVGIRDLAEIISWFDVSEDAVRVTMSRMRREGWFVTRRNGRASYYALSDRGWAVLDEGRPRIFDRRRDDWAGEWHLVVLQFPDTGRSDREKLNKELLWRGYAPLATSTWIASRPRSEGLDAILPPGATVYAFTSRSSSPAEDERIAASHWDLDSLANDYCEFVRSYEPLMSEAHVDGLSDEDVFVSRTEIIHEYRLFPFRDPDLPARLLPNDWPGHEAHGIFLHIVDALADRAWAAFDRVYEQPPPSVNGGTGRS